jgi:hypothetical protein
MTEARISGPTDDARSAAPKTKSGK